MANKSRVDALLEDTDASAPTPEITAADRLILNNLFDSQPQKRAAYLRKIGFEMDPKDDNRFRVAGSTGGYVGKIDPGYNEVYAKNGIAGLAKELVQDAGDVGYDAALVATTKLAPIIISALEGTAVGGPAGAVIGAVAGLNQSIAGNAISYAAGEALKNQLGKLALSEDIPQDYKGTAFQTFLAAVTPKLVKGAGTLAGKAGRTLYSAVPTAQKAFAESTVDAMLATANKFKSTLTPSLLKAAAEEPEKFAPKKLDDVVRLANEEQKKLLGLEPSQGFRRVNDIKPGSALGDALKPLNAEADKLEAQLASDPSRNTSLRDVLSSFENMKSQIENRGVVGQFADSPTPKNSITESALERLDYFQDQIMNTARANLKSQGITNPTPSQLMNAPLDFSQVRKLRKAISDQAYSKDLEGGEFLKQLAGSEPNQLGGKLTKMAEGTNWNDLQSKRYDILNFAQNDAKKLQTTNVLGSFLGDNSQAKDEVILAFENLDRLTGGENTGKFRDLATNQELSKFLENPEIYKKSNPFSIALDKFNEVREGGKKGGLGGALFAAAPKPDAKLQTGEDFVQKLAEKIKQASSYGAEATRRNQAFDQGVSKLQSGVSDNAISKFLTDKFDTNRTLVEAGAEMATPDDPSASLRRTGSPTGARVNEDRVNALLEGL